MNFGAGMTGGRAWVYDADGSFVRDQRYHPDFVTFASFSEVESESQEILRALLEEHAERSASSLAAEMLAKWPESAAAFVQLTPKPQA